MKLLTIFTAPKPFEHLHIRTIQRNAIRSWVELGAEVDVLLMGDENGIAEVAAEFGIPHVRDVRCSEWGTPYVSSLFQRAREYNDNPLLAYVNADILLLPDFLQAARRLAQEYQKFLMVGRRWDMDVTTPLAFTSGWQDEFRQAVSAQGKLHSAAGSDYFLFSRQLYGEMPDLSVGRAGWDNWMIYHARKQNWPVVDVTRDVMVVHQNHDYHHLGQTSPSLPDTSFRPYHTEETYRNVEVMWAFEGAYPIYTIQESNRELVNGQILPRRTSLASLFRRLENRLMPRKKKGLRWRLILWLRTLQSR